MWKTGKSKGLKAAVMGERSIDGDLRSVGPRGHRARARAVSLIRVVFCVLWNGGHTLHRAFDRVPAWSDRTDRVYQRCVCGYETRGWSIDRRDRRQNNYDKSAYSVIQTPRAPSVLAVAVSLLRWMFAGRRKV